MELDRERQAEKMKKTEGNGTADNPEEAGSKGMEVDDEAEGHAGSSMSSSSGSGQQVTSRTSSSTASSASASSSPSGSSAERGGLEQSKRKIDEEDEEAVKRQRNMEVKRGIDEDEMQRAEAKKRRYELDFGEMDHPPPGGDDQEKYYEPGQFLELSTN